MTKDVLISLCGTQFGGGAEVLERAEKFMPGRYYEKNGSRYVLYDETIEGLDKPVKTKLKFGGSFLELIRGGAVNVRMLFEEDKKNMASYNTPYGNILLGITAKKINISENPHEIGISVDYELEADNEHLSDSSIIIKIKEKTRPI